MRKNYLFLALAFTGFFMGNAQIWVDQATNLPVNSGVKEISIVDANTVWVSAYDGSGGGAYPKDITKTVDGGATWTAMNISAIPGTALISDIAGVSADVAFVVTAPSGSGASNNGIWKTTDGGATWTKYTGAFTNGTSFANHVYFWDANNGFAGGDPANGKFEMYKTTDGGATWSLITTAPAPQNGDEFTYVGVKEVVGDNIWCGTSTGRVLRSTDRGATWEAFTSPALDFGGVITEGSTASFAFSDNGTDGLLITNDNGAVFMFSTNDGGATWLDAFPEGVWYGDDVAAVPGVAGGFVTSGINSAGPMGTAYSVNGGIDWIGIDEGNQRGTLRFFNNTTGWCGTFSDGPGGSLGIMEFDGVIGDMGVSDLNKSNLQVYPNPASSVVNFTSDKEIKMVNIISLNGKVISQVKSTKVDVSSLAAGVYIAQVRYADGGVENKKIVVK